MDSHEQDAYRFYLLDDFLARVGATPRKPPGRKSELLEILDEQLLQDVLYLYSKQVFPWQAPWNPYAGLSQPGYNFPNSWANDGANVMQQGRLLSSPPQVLSAANIPSIVIEPSSPAVFGPVTVNTASYYGPQVPHNPSMAPLPVFPDPSMLTTPPLQPAPWRYYCPDCHLIISTAWIKKRITNRQNHRHAPRTESWEDHSPKFIRKYDFVPSLVPIKRRFCTLCTHRVRIEEVKQARIENKQTTVNKYDDTAKDLEYRIEAWTKEKQNLLSKQLAWEMNDEQKYILMSKGLLGRKE